MIDLSKKGLPCSVEVHGKIYPIHTDFQYYIIFSRMVKENHKLGDFDFFYTEEIPADRQQGLNELLKFAFPKRELPKDLGDDTGDIILDYEKDADFIYSAFYHYYNIDLMAENFSLHWYKFSSLLNGLKETKLNDIMGFRSYKPRQTDGKEYKSQMLKLKEMWRIETPLTEDEQKELEKFERLNRGKRD
mgnify:FL=1